VKLVMTLLVSDEQDLLEANLDYHLAQGVDFVVVTADRAGPPSVTATVERYVERGVCHLVEEEPSGYLQSEWVTRMARMATVEFGADWVINSDIDEFYWPETGSLKGIFSAIPEEFGTLTLPVTHFVPRPAGEFFADRMTVRETRSLKPSGKGVLTKVAHRGVADVEVSRGGHRVTGTGLTPLLGWEPILGLHFPLRSYSQFEAKVVRDGRTADAGVRSLRRELYEHHSAGRLLDLYERRVVDDAEARSGVEEGRLVIDERLKRFFEAAEHVPPPEPAPDEVDSLRAEMERAVQERERHPLTLEVRRLEGRLETAEERLEESRVTGVRLRDERNAAREDLKAEREDSKLLRAQLDKARRGLEKAERRLEEAERRERPFGRVRKAIGRRGAASGTDAGGGERSGGGDS